MKRPEYAPKIPLQRLILSSCFTWIASMNSERFAEFLGVFVDVAREGNFSRVARKRGMSPSSVARQVDVLEAYLDNKLFLRSTRTLSLTDAGQVLLRRAQRILDELADI